MHPAKEGFSALPFFDEFDLSTVDILLISQYVRYTFPFPCILLRRSECTIRGGKGSEIARSVIGGGRLDFNDIGPVPACTSECNNRLFLNLPCPVCILLLHVSSTQRQCLSLGDPLSSIVTYG